MKLFDKIENFIVWKTLRGRKKHPIYIIPTLDGFKVLGLNFLLLIIGLIYANNYVLLFNFILFCLVLGSMFYTHHNLRGLNIFFIGVENGYEKEANLLKITFQSTNPEGHDRIEVEAFHPDLISFSGKPFFMKTQSSIAGHEMSLVFQGRGKKTLNYVGISTKFPLGFFKAFTYFNIDSSFYCYPERVDQKLTIAKLEDGTNNEKEETELRNYRLGDPLKRVDWKKLAKSNHWYTKSLSGNEHQIIYITLEKNSTEIESQIKQASFLISQAETNGMEYGIRMNDQVIITSDKGSIHQENCLRFLSDL